MEYICEGHLLFSAFRSLHAKKYLVLTLWSTKLKSRIFMSHFQMSINRHFHQCLINKGIIVAVNHDLFVLFYFFSMSSTHMRKSIGHDCFDCHTKRHFKTIPVMPRECQCSVDRPIYDLSTGLCPMKTEEDICTCMYVT